MKNLYKIIVVFLLIFSSYIFSQSLCERLLEVNTKFLNTANDAVKQNSSLNTTLGKKVKFEFDDHLSYLDKFAKEYPGEKNIMGLYKVKAFAGFAYYLFNTRQYEALQNLSKKSDGILEINFDQYDNIICEGKGTGPVQYFDEESEQYYTANAEKTVTKYAMKSDEFWVLCDMIYPYFAFANYVNGDVQKGNQYFMQCYDKRYFTSGKNDLMRILAKEILIDYDESKAATDVEFAAAVVYFRKHGSSADPAYQKAINIVKKDENFSNKQPKNQYMVLSNPAAKSEVYFVIVDGLVYSESENKDDAVAMLKKYLMVEKKTGVEYFKPQDFANLFYHGKKNNDALTKAILKDNDSEFMTKVADKLLKHFKEYDTNIAGDLIYDTYLYYKKAGQDSKAKKAFMTIPADQRSSYKEL